jgi:hypothetical protein
MNKTTDGQAVSGVGSRDGLELELAALNEAVDAFAKAMKAKLAKKAREGWTGWHSPAFAGMIVSRLIKKANLVEFDRKQAVDIANLSMMLWYQAKRSNAAVKPRRNGD